VKLSINQSINQSIKSSFNIDTSVTNSETCAPITSESVNLVYTWTPFLPTPLN